MLFHQQAVQEYLVSRKLMIFWCLNRNVTSYVKVAASPPCSVGRASGMIKMFAANSYSFITEYGVYPINRYSKLF